MLSVAAVYDGLQRALGATRLYRRIAADHLRLHDGDRLLDIGCGTAAILGVLPDGVTYEGFDVSEKYIEAARKRHGTRGRFWASRVSAATVATLPPFDAVLSFAVLHHLDDDEADRLIELAWQALEPGGRFVTYDPCFIDGQGRISRCLVGHDRGQNVRRPDGYAALAERRFGKIERTILDGHLRIPYTAVVMTCHKPS